MTDQNALAAVVLIGVFIAYSCLMFWIGYGAGRDAGKRER